MNTTIITKSFSNGRIKEVEIRKTRRELSAGEKMEMAVIYLLTKGIKGQLARTQ